VIEHVVVLAELSLLVTVLQARVVLDAKEPSRVSLA
jgi:hypothetical protein